MNELRLGRPCVCRRRDNRLRLLFLLMPVLLICLGTREAVHGMILCTRRRLRPMSNKRKGRVNGIGWRAVSKNGCGSREGNGFHHKIIWGVIHVIPSQISRLQVFDGRHQVAMAMPMGRMVHASKSIPNQARDKDGYRNAPHCKTQKVVTGNSFVVY